MGFEYSEMVLLKQQTVELAQSVHKIHMKIANKLGLMAVNRVKKITPVAPVNGGTLKENWRHSVVRKGDTYIIVVYNQIEYASFVESGHRIVVGGKTVGWVEGRFMLKLTMEDMEKIAATKWQEDIEKEMRRVFGS